MHKTIVFLSTGLCLSLSALAAEQPGEIAQLYRVKAKPGQEIQLEEGAKQHYHWHRQQGDKWTWETWQFMSGEFFGQLVARTGYYHWRDFDAHAEFSQRDNADVVTRLGDHIESTTVWFSRTHSKSSNLPEMGSKFPLINVNTYRINPGKESQFLHVIGAIHQVLKDSGWSHHYIWTERVAGGTGSEFDLILPMDSWAAMEPPEKQVRAVLEEELGRQGADSLFEMFVSCVESYQNEILIRRLDLSYTP